MTYDFSIIRHLRKKNGWTIYGLSERSGVSYVALSKLERNMGNPELKTLDRIARAFSIETHNLLALAEHQRPMVVDVQELNDEHGFHIKQAVFNQLRVGKVSAQAGSVGTAEHEHGDDYEVCVVLSGKINLYVRDSVYEVAAGQAVRFDCIFEHRYEVLEDADILHVMLSKHC